MEAISYEKEALALAEMYYGEDSPYYAACLSGLAILYSEIEDFENAIHIQKRALEINKKVYGITSENYTGNLHDLALLYSEIGQDVEAVRLLQQCVEIDKKNKDLLEWDSESIAISIMSLATEYCKLGNFLKAISLCDEALTYLKEENTTKANILSNVAMCYSRLGMYNDAISLNKEALHIREKLSGREHPGYAITLGSLALDYITEGNYEEAMKSLNEEMMIIEKIYGRSHTNYAGSLTALSMLYWELGEYEKAIPLTKEAISIYKEKLGKQHTRYQTTVWQLASILQEAHKYEELPSLAMEVFSLKKDLIQSSFRKMTSKERELYWKSNNNFIESYIPGWAFYVHSDTLCSLAYNAILFSKGLLLDMNTEMKRSILESGNERAIDLFNQLSREQLIIEKLQQQSFQDRKKRYRFFGTANKPHGRRIDKGKSCL